LSIKDIYENPLRSYYVFVYLYIHIINCLQKMEDLSHEFNFLNNCKSNYSETINKARQIDKICSEICDQTLQNYDADVNKQKDLKNFFSITQNDIKNNIDDRINQVTQIYHHSIYQIPKT